MRWLVLKLWVTVPSFISTTEPMLAASGVCTLMPVPYAAVDGAELMTGLAPLNRYGGEKISELFWSVGASPPLKRPPPRASTRASGRSRALEGYRGDHSSAASTALSTPSASVLGPPPVASTLPSGSSVSVWKVRAKFMGAVERHVGAGWFISSTNVVAVEGITGWSGSTERPDFMILPGAYITELPPSTAFGSTTDQVCVEMSSTRLTIGASVVAAASTRPSPSTNLCGDRKSV